MHARAKFLLENQYGAFTLEKKYGALSLFSEGAGMGYGITVTEASGAAGCDCPRSDGCDYESYINEAVSLLSQNMDLLEPIDDDFLACVVSRMLSRGGVRIRVTNEPFFAQWIGAYPLGLEGAAWPPTRPSFNPIYVFCGTGTALWSLAYYDSIGQSHSSVEYTSALAEVAETIVHEILHNCGMEHDTADRDIAAIADLADKLAARAQCACWTKGDFGSDCVCGATFVSCTANSYGSCDCSGTCTAGCGGPGSFAVTMDGCG
ncbi:MAG: hypothetical protein Q8P18_22660 [Pseudomonadota bacterium]|nr:hypothetical protein [Pseudomonadota bacterium]